MRRCAQLGLGSFLCAFALAGRGHAEPTPPAVVWYRASEQCPTGVAFLAKLADKSARARLAEPADHFDFLVTLVASGGETIGRLERQTRSGTVAIRELRDSSCERVADALALGLSLTLEPRAEPEGEPDTVATPAPPETSGPVVALGPPTSAPADGGAPVPPARRARALSESVWSLGLTAAATEGATPRPLWQGFAFVDLARTHSGAAPKFAARLGVIAAFGSVSTQVGPVKHWLGAGRAEVCPWRFGAAKVGVWPCADFELGVVGASDSRPSGLHARDVWAAPGAALRLVYELAPPISVEVQAGGLVPLVRETFYAGSEPLYSAQIIVFQASVGVSARVW